MNYFLHCFCGKLCFYTWLSNISCHAVGDWRTIAMFGSLYVIFNRGPYRNAFRHILERQPWSDGFLSISFSISVSLFCLSESWPILKQSVKATVVLKHCIKRAYFKETTQEIISRSYRKENMYKVYFYGWDLTLTTERKCVCGAGSLSSLAAWPEHLGISLPHIHYFIYCPNLILHDFPDSEGWQLLSTVQKVCSTRINNYTSCWSFFLKGALSKKSNLNKSRSYRCEWSWNPWVPLLLLLFLSMERSYLVKSKCY